jgi:hypothetical protein
MVTDEVLTSAIGMGAWDAAVFRSALGANTKQKRFAAAVAETKSYLAAHGMASASTAATALPAATTTTIPKAPVRRSSFNGGGGGGGFGGGSGSSDESNLSSAEDQDPSHRSRWGSAGAAGDAVLALQRAAAAASAKNPLLTDAACPPAGAGPAEEAGVSGDPDAAWSGGRLAFNPAAAAAPVWVLDSQACAGCQARFGLLLRRHHCRACGDVVCSACSPPPWRFLPPAWKLGPDKQRCCSACAAAMDQVGSRGTHCK